MKPLPHRYDVLLAAGATGYATLTTPGAPDLRAAPPGVDRDRTLRILEKSERTCLVSASLSTPIRLAPEIVTG